MWKVRQRQVGQKRFFEVYKVIPQTNDIITKGWWETEAEAIRLADNLNKLKGKVGA